jgi:Tfp pilus assembly protein PilZ
MNDCNLKIERRRMPRYRTAMPARFRFLDLKRPLTHEAFTNDIGEGGLFINARLKEEEIGRKIDLEIQLPDAEVVIKSLAQVTWIKRSLQEKVVLGLGIKLTEILPEERKKLDSYIAKFSFHIPLKLKFIRPPDFKLTEREKRNFEILDVLRRQNPVSKTQIAQEIDLNIVTISNYIEEFKKKGIIFERGLDESSGGRRPSLLELNGEFGFMLGAEVNFLKGYITAVVTDFSLRPMFKKSTELKQSGKNFSDSLIDSVSEVVKASDLDRSRFIGMGVGLTGMRNEYDANLKEFLEDRIGLPVLIGIAL